MYAFLKRDKKTRLARLLYHTRITRMFQALPGARGLFVLNYHRIRPDGAAFTTPFDEGVFCHTASQLENQLQWLRRNCLLLSERDLLACIERGAAPSRPAVHITFDDGYRDNFTTAYPLLKSLGIPATFFIPSDIIETRRVGWWDRISHIVSGCERPAVDIEGRRFALPDEKAALKSFLHERLKLQPFSATRGLVERAAELCGVGEPDPALQDEQLMTWEQVAEVADNGIAIGSHTQTHRVLATLDECSQRQELLESKKVLQRKTGREIVSIAYPVGEHAHFTRATVALAGKCGYRLGYSANTGMARWETLDPLCISRISYPMDDIRTLSALIVFPGIFFRAASAAAS